MLLSNSVTRGSRCALPTTPPVTGLRAVRDSRHDCQRAGVRLRQPRAPEPERLLQRRWCSAFEQRHADRTECTGAGRRWQISVSRIERGAHVCETWADRRLQSTNIDDEVLSFVLGACNLRKLSIRNCPDVTGATIAGGFLRVLDISVCSITDDNLGANRASPAHADVPASNPRRSSACGCLCRPTALQRPSAERAPICGR